MVYYLYTISLLAVGGDLSPKAHEAAARRGLIHPDPTIEHYNNTQGALSVQTP